MASMFRKDSPTFDRRNFDMQMMKILGELLDFCKEQSIEFSDQESFYCIQKKSSTSKYRSISKEDIKIKEGIDLLTRREPKGMKKFVCWTCKEFGHFSSRCPKRVRKYRKSSLSDEDEEFKASMKRFLNDYDDKDNELKLAKKEEDRRDNHGNYY